ncbi:hypothetical protein PHLCEN_2v2597 [Hermanssonia centrifuga]|uniref:Pseudouridine synthase I TruA alpha/beta domain-containing protein n=1 Tax=Hermanssonia centrifuga TaxID=98765 RepID=A0A2R6RLG2_9APHY|nr:hypothetical protein PHLCEN_2v2597 [Hermanssonia centrifuga]
MAHDARRFENWSREHFISHIRKLEHTLSKPSRITPHTQPATQFTSTPPRVPKPFDFSVHPTRKIALKFAYQGEHYNGLAVQKGYTPLPTVEEVLWNALVYTRLVDPKGGFEGCGWERCGRTDRGVSSAGQVVSLWIRSCLRDKDASNSSVKPSLEDSHPVEESDTFNDGYESDVSGLDDQFGGLNTWDEAPSNTNLNVPAKNPKLTDDDELKYVSCLNGVLPPTIRVLAWTPVEPNFSARFACQYRHYKYFFTSRGLDIEAMRNGAKRLVGEHDFRNLCKLDPGKQITNFNRSIHRADITALGLVSDEGGHGPGQVYVFDLVGSAFLYNQVRHIMAILFLIGTRFEHPSLVTALLNVDPANPLPPFHPDDPPLPVVSTKPLYQMASALPLVLWEGGYRDGALTWRTDKISTNKEDADSGSNQANVPSQTQKDGKDNLFHQQRAVYERSLIRAALDEHFLHATAQHHDRPLEYLPIRPDAPIVEDGVVFGVPLGGGTEKRAAKYVPVLERERSEGVEVLNERWRQTKGTRRVARDTEGDADVEATNS